MPVPAKRREDGEWYEQRDERGVEVHWAWLRRHWHDLADKLEQFEERNRR